MLSDGDVQEKMCLALIKQVEMGSAKAFELVRDTIGEKPADGGGSDPDGSETGVVMMPDILPEPEPPEASDEQ